MDLMQLWKSYFDSELEIFALDLGRDLVHVKHLEDGSVPTADGCRAIFDKWDSLAREVLNTSDVAIYFDTQMLEVDAVAECLSELPELDKAHVLKRRDGSRVYAGIVNWSIERFGPIIAKMVCTEHNYLLFLNIDNGEVFQPVDIGVRLKFNGAERVQLYRDLCKKRYPTKSKRRVIGRPSSERRK